MNRASGEDRGRVLIPLARHAIATELGVDMDAAVDRSAAWLQAPGASFVTLNLHGALRGCMGSLQACRPLLEDVQANAVAAAFHDPRFAPLSVAEYGAMKVEVSLLSALQSLACESAGDMSETGAGQRIRPGTDGVVLAYGAHRATFLPQVWEQLPDPAQFMAHLKTKAGLAADFSHPDLHLFTYQVENFREADG